jgi:WD40 repeat protein
VIAAGDDGIVTALDAASGAFLAHGPASHRLAVRALAVADRVPSPLVVSTGDDETMRLWEFGAATATTVVTNGVLTCAAIVPELSVLAVGGEDGWVGLYRLADGSAMGQSVGLHDGRVTALTAVTAAGRTAFVSAGADGVLRLSYLDSQREALHLAEHNSQVRALCVVGSDHEAAVASGGDDGVVRIWGLPGGRLSGRALNGRHQGAVTALAAVGGSGLDSASFTVVSGGQDGILFVRTPEELHPIETGSPVTSLVALGDGVIVGTESGLLSLRFPR